jgi:hypothetical protein
MACSPIAILVIGVALFFQAAPVAATPTPEVAPPAAVMAVCNGKYKGGLKPSPNELADILKKHTDWWKDVSVRGWRSEWSSSEAFFMRPVNLN